MNYDRQANPAFLAHRMGFAHSDCWCARCEREAKAAFRDLSPIEALSGFMHLCPDCGSKRCARAADHRNACPLVVLSAARDEAMATFWGHVARWIEPLVAWSARTLGRAQYRRKQRGWR